MSDQVPQGFRAGSLVAGYRLEERIGQGGMAVVFRAYDSRLDRRVALKILAPSLAEDEAFRLRFVPGSRARPPRSMTRTSSPCSRPVSPMACCSSPCATSVVATSGR